MSIKPMEYKVYGLPIDTKSYNTNNDGTLIITGVASTTNKDYANEIVSPKVLKSLAKQAIGINLYRDHNKYYEGGIGAIIDAWVEDNQLWVKAKILSEYAKEIKERIDIGMNFGFSIGGFPKKQRTNEGLLIVDYDLKDITLTYIPMNWDTYGTVEYKSQNLITSNCLTGACYHAITNDDGETMKEEETKTENIEEPVLEDKSTNGAGLNDEQLNQVKDLINEFGAELEPRLLENINPKLSQIAEEAANKAAEAVSERILAEFKATNEVKSSNEIPEEEIKSETDEIEEEVKSEPGITEPENNDNLEIEDESNNDDLEDIEDEKDDVDDDEIEEKSIPQIIHNEIVKQMNEKSLNSKLNTFIKSKAKQVSKMEEKSQNRIRRDSYGRNLDYV